MQPNQKLPVDRLSADLQRTGLRWERATELWNDPVRDHFEQRYWKPTLEHATMLHHEMERLALTVSRAKRELK